MSESNYWDRFWRRRVSRRRLMSGAMVAGGGLAAASVVGCSTDESGGGGGGGGIPAEIQQFIDFQDGTATSPLQYVDGRREFTPAPVDSRGGTLTYIGFDPV
ncbi:MAG: hypothetical protein JRJ80_18585, partial [Deltaproteobacteria bacterium]|nr:hypothetical protein [Deltaproteobacteria bacterium]